MRVVAGELRGRRLATPPGTATRPTTERTREAIFNALYSLGGVDDLVVADLFAGSGALGIEALSRGAAHVTFVERERVAAEVIEDNLDSLGLGVDVARVLRADATTVGARLGPLDLVLADPPYDFGAWTDLVASLDTDLLVIEAAGPPDLPAGWDVIRSRSYGAAHVVIARRVP